MNDRTFLFECYINILTDTLITILTFTFLRYLIIFVIFTLQIVSDTHDIRLINEYARSTDEVTKDTN